MASRLLRPCSLHHRLVAMPKCPCLIESAHAWRDDPALHRPLPAVAFCTARCLQRHFKFGSSGISHSANLPGNAAGNGASYKAYLHFQEIVLQDWSVRTENPYEANLFYVPAFNAIGSMFVGWREYIENVVQYVRYAHPFFNRTSGAAWGQEVTRYLLHANHCGRSDLLRV